MVHKWLLRRGLRKILAGLILVFVLGPVFFTISSSMNVEMPIVVTIPEYEWLGWSDFEIQVFKNSRGIIVGGIGIIFLIVGIGYLLATVILEHLKKRRYAH